MNGRDGYLLCSSLIVSVSVRFSYTVQLMSLNINLSLCFTISGSMCFVWCYSTNNMDNKIKIYVHSYLDYNLTIYHWIREIYSYIFFYFNITQYYYILLLWRKSFFLWWLQHYHFNVQHQSSKLLTHIFTGLNKWKIVKF